VPITSPDGDIWFRLANSTTVGFANLQQVFGVDASVAVSDWSATHAVDDLSALVNQQFTQKSWNFHSIYPALTCTGCAPATYPLPVQDLVAGVPKTGTILSGGATHFRLAVPAGVTGTLTVTSPSPAGLKLLVVKTK